MKDKPLKLIRSLSICKNGPCPAIHQSEDGRYFVQGYEAPNELEKQLSVPTGERLVEVPKELLEKFLEM